MKIRTKNFNLIWVPHKFDADHETERWVRSEELLQILEKCQQINFVTLLTGDESLSFLEHLESRIWAASRDEISENVKTKLIRKSMISIIWNITGIKSLIALPKGMKYNRQSFVNNLYQI
jgi:hypothetical protein